MAAVAIGSSIICICISNSMSTPAAVAPVSASAPPAAPVPRGMLVPFPAPDQKDYVLTGSGNWTSMPVSAGITVQNDVTGSRELGKVYRNTTGKPMFVSVNYQSGTNQMLMGLSDHNDPPVSLVTIVQAMTNIGGTLVFWVLNNNYYKLMFGISSPTVRLWTEWY